MQQIQASLIAFKLALEHYIESMKILITGGTGFIGQELIQALWLKGHEVHLVTRGKKNLQEDFPGQVLKWPLELDEAKPVLDEIEAVIHLAGEPIAAKRWSERQKDKIKGSRTDGTREFVDILRGAPKLKTFISSSAIGYYGNRGGEELTENSQPGTGFLPHVCAQWEEEALKLSRPGLRIALLRTGIVLGRGGGILEQLEPLYRNKVGGPVASGKQYMSWIHIRDWVKACLFCLENEAISGPVNLTAPEPVSSKAFSGEMARVFKQKIEFPAPAFALKLAMGEMSSIALDSQYVLPTKLIDHKFGFEFQELGPALEDLYGITESYREVDDLYKAQQWVPESLEKTFIFFCDEKNLEKITPPLLNFKVLDKSTSKLMKNTIINYKLKIHGIPTRWQTLISDWDPPHRFVDTQLKGPYKKWHHTHNFKPVLGGTLMTDEVRYRLPMGWLGRFFGHWLVKKDVKKIFAYRRQVISQVINQKNNE